MSTSTRAEPAPAAAAAPSAAAPSAAAPSAAAPSAAAPSAAAPSAAAPSAATPVAAAAAALPAKRERRWLVPGIVVALALVLAAWRYWPWRGTETTDDAFIDADVVSISPSIAGRVVAVEVADNQHVTAGQPLVQLDPAPLQAHLDEARAAVALAESTGEITRQLAEMARIASDSTLASAKADVGAAQATVAQTAAEADAAEARAQSSEAENGRFSHLAEGAATADQRERIDRQARAARAEAIAALRKVDLSTQQLAQAQAKLAAAASGTYQVAAARAGVERSVHDVEKARAELTQAELAFSYRQLLAPFSGRIARRSVQVGSYLEPGQAVMALVSDDLYVVANLKENQLRRLAPRQEAEIHIDAYPQVTFAAHVESLQPGSGSRFSLLPAENATGNFVKVVQRVPVKLVFDRPIDLELYRIGPGMSVEPVIRLR